MKLGRRRKMGSFPLEELMQQQWRMKVPI